MKIATLNIDWANKQKSKTHVHKIEATLLKINADILIITECVASLNLPNYHFLYQTKCLPSGSVYEEINYSEYLHNNTAIRVCLYSRYKAINTYNVRDSYTSLCREFETEKGNITIHATIIGTQFNKLPYAQIELNNCIQDCLDISAVTSRLCLVGDLNTSFFDKEEMYQIRGIKSKESLIDLCYQCNIDLTTNISRNIDHILLPKTMKDKFNIMTNIFIEKDILSDHKGVIVSID